jgi:hypothetical protein
MKAASSFFTILAILPGLLLISCNSNTVKNKEYITFEDLDIPKQWIEIPNPNEPGPKRGMRDLRTVHLTKIEKKNAIVFNYGYESQWFEIKKIEKINDSLLFETILPFDSTEIMNISAKFLDNDKLLARWIIDGISCNYSPYKDTISGSRVLIENNR